MSQNHLLTYHAVITISVKAITVNNIIWLLFPLLKKALSLLGSLLVISELMSDSRVSSLEKLRSLVIDVDSLLGEPGLFIAFFYPKMDYFEM